MLGSLPEREYRAGLAEVIKYGIICDAALFDANRTRFAQAAQRDFKTLAEIVARCCEIKAEVVGKDETEGGLRAILNFGHTIGHALEAISHYGKYLHGEAISVGQIAAAEISVARLSGFPAREVERIQRSVPASAACPRTAKLNRTQRKRLLEAMRLDKKVSGGDIKFVLARRIGTGGVRAGSVPTALIERARSSARNHEFSMSVQSAKPSSANTSSCTSSSSGNIANTSSAHETRGRRH